MGTLIKIDNTFQNLEHFFTYLVRKIFDVENISGDIDEIDFESDQSSRIFVLMSDGKEITIRTWNIYDTDEKIIIDYSIYDEII
jgi:hypothetical protein